MLRSRLLHSDWLILANIVRDLLGLEVPECLIISKQIVLMLRILIFIGHCSEYAKHSPTVNFFPEDDSRSKAVKIMSLLSGEDPKG